MSKKKSRAQQRAPIQARSEMRALSSKSGRLVRDRVKRVSLLPKRENIYFTPYEKRALAKHEQNAHFTPLQNRVKIPVVDLVKNDGYLTKGTFLDKIAFRNPFKQSVCVKRAQRRRVIFALNLRGKGSGAKKHKFSLTSGISCKG